MYHESMLRLNNLHKSFGDLVAVDGLTVEIGRGEVFGLLGPNGAGKTTTISLITGLLTPDEGTIEIDGAGPISNPRARMALGVAPQALALYDDLSARENLEFFGQLYRLGSGELRARTAAVLDAVGLAARQKDRAETFSGGMKRRLNLAVALLHDPPVLLLDEPTAGVDPQSRNNILNMVRAFKQAGKTVVYTTHYMEEAQKLCDRVGIIDKGRMLAIGSVDQLIHAHGGENAITVERAGVEDRVLSRDPARDVARLLAAGDVDTLRIDRPDLEGVFLTLTGRSLRD